MKFPQNFISDGMKNWNNAIQMAYKLQSASLAPTDFFLIRPCELLLHRECELIQSTFIRINLNIILPIAK